MSLNSTIVVVPGDGIGPAITESVKKIILSTGVNLEFEEHQMGKDASKEEIDSALQAFIEYGVMLKGPTETPVATKGQKSFNVTSRKGNGLYINFRRSKSFHPLVQTQFPNQDIAIFRENEEGLYAAIEHQHSPDVVQALSYKTFSGMHKIIRAAFEYAVDYRKSKVCCLHKGNILKKTEGSFVEIFEKIAMEYPQIESSSQIVDDGMAKVATNPESYEVIVTENLFGDILSDITTALTGSLGLGGSSNIGYRGAMFEAIHGTGPDIVPLGKMNSSDKHIANPSGLLQAGILMLEYIGTPECMNSSELIKEAWFDILEQGFHTGDLARRKDGKANPITKKVVNTNEFTQLIIDKILVLKKSQAITNLAKSDSAKLQFAGSELVSKCRRVRPYLTPSTIQKTIGADVFINWTGKEDKIILDELQILYGFKPSDDFKLDAFETLHQWFDWTLWLKRSLTQLSPTTVHELVKEFDLESFLSQSALNLETLDAVERWSKVEKHHIDLIKIVTLSLVKKINSSIDDLPIKLEMMSNRGQCVYPDIINPDLVDQYRCRFLFTAEDMPSESGPSLIPKLLSSLIESGINPVKTEGLYEFRQKGSGIWTKGYGSSYGQGMGYSFN